MVTLSECLYYNMDLIGVVKMEFFLDMTLF